jgi:DMSO reductase anchor subunit
VKAIYVSEVVNHIFLAAGRSLDHRHSHIFVAVVVRYRLVWMVEKGWRTEMVVVVEAVRAVSMVSIYENDTLVTWT